MPPAAGVSRPPDGPQLVVSRAGAPPRNARDEIVEDREHGPALGFAQLADAGGVVGDRLAHDGALRLAESLGGSTQRRHRIVVERKRDFHHIATILLPYSPALIAGWRYPEHMRRALLLVLLLGTAWLPVRTSADALADVRAALGGEAALSRITSIHATGKIVQAFGTRDGTLEVSLQNPDRFVRVTRTARNPSGAYSGGVDKDGRQIDRRLPADQDPRYGVLSMPDLSTDVTVTTLRVGFRGSIPISGRGGGPAGVGGAPRQYAAFVIPLLVAVTPAYPAKVTSTSDTVRFEGDDGVDWVLTLDPATRLPATLEWSSGTAPSRFVMTLSDYRKVDQVVWPFRVQTRNGDRFDEDVTIKKYEINGKIDDKVFR